MRLWENARKALFTEPPYEQQAAFRRDCAVRNNWRFAVIPWMSIAVQLCSVILYLGIYPAVYPDRPRLDPAVFLGFSAAYLAVSAVYIGVFARLRRSMEDAGFLGESESGIYSYLVLFLVFEGVEAILVLPVADNIYRYLFSYLVIAFLPILPRVGKFLILALYTSLTELGLAWLVRCGVSLGSRYGEIVLLFFVVCVVMDNIVYTGTVNSFELRQELLALNGRLQLMIDKDPLTEINNRRAFSDYVRRIWDGCKRSGQPVGLMMIDIDDFKAYNDRYGHQAGDDCLVTIAQFIAGQFQRSMDMVARYGGEEFVVLMPHTGPEGVAHKAEALRAGIEAMAMPHEGLSPDSVVTVSIGATALVPSREQRFEQIIKRADDALYTAKETGRNRVCFDRDEAADHSGSGTAG